MSWIDTWIWKYNLGSIFDPSGFLVLIQVVDEEPRAIAEVHIVPAIDGPANNLQAQIIQYSLEPHSLARKGSVHVFLIQILECNWVKSSSLWTAKKVFKSGPRSFFATSSQESWKCFAQIIKYHQISRSMELFLPFVSIPSKTTWTYSHRFMPRRASPCKCGLRSGSQPRTW